MATLLFCGAYSLFKHTNQSAGLLQALLNKLLEYGGQFRIPVDVAVAELLGGVEGDEADGGDAVGAASVVQFHT